MSEETSLPVVRLQVYSDYTCPWCYLGTARVERARERLAGRVDLQVEWEPFEIHPEVPEEGLPVSVLGYPAAQWEQMQAHLRGMARQDGLDVGKADRLANTHRALAASAYVRAEAPERFEAFHRSLFRTYFAEGRNIATLPVLREVAEETGVDADAMERALEEGRYEERLRATSRAARERGITGTPTFVFEDRYAVVGAQSPEVLESVVERVLQERGE